MKLDNEAFFNRKPKVTPPIKKALEDLNDSFTFGRLDEKTREEMPSYATNDSTKILHKLIDLKNPQKFDTSLEYLMEFGHDYTRHCTGSIFYKKEVYDLIVVNNYLEFLEKESGNQNSNLLLSKYVHQVSKGNAFIGEHYTKTETGYTIEE